jgi:hypothetical protein
MALPRLQKIATWFQLVLALLMGTAPVVGLVLCQEPDGGLALEAQAPGGSCGGCLHAEPGEAASIVIAEDHAACPCHDVSLGNGAEDPRVQPKLVELPQSPPTELHAEPCNRSVGVRAEFRGLIQAHPPRIAPVLALIRSVLLLV